MFPEYPQPRLLQGSLQTLGGEGGVPQAHRRHGHPTLLHLAQNQAAQHQTEQEQRPLLLPGHGGHGEGGY